MDGEIDMKIAPGSGQIGEGFESVICSPLVSSPVLPLSGSGKVQIHAQKEEARRCCSATQAPLSRAAM
jgi:hypothetical protein